MADARLLALPWVKQLKKPVPCEGIKHSKVALKHVFSMGGRPPEGIPDRARCKNPALYRYTVLKSTYSNSGNYCYSHAVQILVEDTEMARYRRWRKRADNARARQTPTDS
jgi:hypothetical protein